MKAAGAVVPGTASVGEGECLQLPGSERENSKYCVLR